MRAVSVLEVSRPEVWDELHAVVPGAVKLQPVESVDGARRLFSVEWSPSDATRLVGGAEGRKHLDRALDRAAWAAAAQLVGLGRQLVDLTVEYCQGRVQFGQPIGAFQAVKHHLANALTKLEFARPPAYSAVKVDGRRAYAVARGGDTPEIAARPVVVHGMTLDAYFQQATGDLRKALDLVWKANSELRHY